MHKLIQYLRVKKLGKTVWFFKKSLSELQKLPYRRIVQRKMYCWQQNGNQIFVKGLGVARNIPCLVCV